VTGARILLNSDCIVCLHLFENLCGRCYTPGDKYCPPVQTCPANVTVRVMHTIQPYLKILLLIILLHSLIQFITTGPFLIIISAGSMHRLDTKFINPLG
jgi:hypothetical protein